MTNQLRSSPRTAPKDIPAIGTPENNVMHSQATPDAVSAARTQRPKLTYFNPAMRAPIHISSPARSQLIASSNQAEPAESPKRALALAFKAAIHPP
jgi:hypothetical protein